MKRNLIFTSFIRIPTISAQKDMKCKVSHRFVDELLKYLTSADARKWLIQLRFRIDEINKSPADLHSY